MLNKEVVIVSGGAGLLGVGFIESIIKNNGIAVIADINQESLSKNVKRLSKEFPELRDCFYSTHLDINSKESIKKCIDDVHKKFGKIDALVNNAYPRNTNFGKHFFDVQYDDFIDNVSMNLGGYFLCSQLMADYFINHSGGHIINISSIYGVIPPKFEIYEGTPMTTPVEYAVFKSAIIHLTKYMAQILKKKNVRVNSISPGGILDGQNTVFLKKYNSLCSSKGMLDVLDISGALIFLLSHNSKYINGQNIIIDDGFTL